MFKIFDKKYLLLKLNKYGLYTREQLIKELQEQAERIENHNLDKKKQSIKKIEDSLKELLNKNIHFKETYFSITPFFDNQHEFNWIITKIPEIKNNRNMGEILAKNINDITPNNRSNFLYFDIYLNEEKKPYLIEIVDLRTSPNNKGVGSHLLQKLEQIADNLGIKYIKGWLSPVDILNRDNQIKFYNKNGYTIKFKDIDNTDCSIFKELKKPPKLMNGLQRI